MGKPKLSEVRLTSDDEAERFVEEADLTQFDLSGGVKLSAFEFQAKDTSIHMRLPRQQLTRIKAEAERRGVPYQRFMRELMERGMRTLNGDK
jgi:predicted DNA binding CopG/RHH family protein